MYMFSHIALTVLFVNFVNNKLSANLFFLSYVSGVSIKVLCKKYLGLNRNLDLAVNT